MLVNKYQLLVYYMCRAQNYRFYRQQSIDYDQLRASSSARECNTFCSFRPPIENFLRRAFQPTSAALARSTAYKTSFHSVKPRFGLWLLYACAARFRSVLRRPSMHRTCILSFFKNPIITMKLSCVLLYSSVRNTIFCKQNK